MGCSSVQPPSSTQLMSSVGDLVGLSVGVSVRLSVGELVGAFDGLAVGGRVKTTVAIELVSTLTPRFEEMASVNALPVNEFDMPLSNSLGDAAPIIPNEAVT